MSQTTKQLMHYACWLTKATNTHSEYVILIAVPLQQWLHGRITLLRMYVHWYLVTELNFMNFEILMAVNFTSEEWWARNSRTRTCCCYYYYYYYYYITVQSNANSRILNGLLQVSPVFWPQFPIWNFAFLNICLYTFPPSAFWSSIRSTSLLVFLFFYYPFC